LLCKPQFGSLYSTNIGTGIPLYVS
jgi:hypothetical protein